ncbi:hypothetical protein [Deinococcus knuensis]|uniref:hypothetical protein n=1 Tax=Deinococcus knuensis TaxID=1837380 RepID=UPI00166BC32B|nr:hypothetical protein [Deinococcus knuensis]
MTDRPSGCGLTLLLTCVLGVPAVYALGTSVAAGLNASFITPHERVLGELWGALFCLCTVLLAALWSTHFVLRGRWLLLSAARWRRVALWVAGGLLLTAAGFYVAFEVRMRQVAAGTPVGALASLEPGAVKSGRH